MPTHTHTHACARAHTHIFWVQVTYGVTLNNVILLNIF